MVLVNIPPPRGNSASRETSVVSVITRRPRFFHVLLQRRAARGFCFLLSSALFLAGKVSSVLNLFTEGRPIAQFCATRESNERYRRTYRQPPLHFPRRPG